MRHHHPQRRPDGRVPSEGDVEVPQWHHPIPGWRKPITIARHAYGDVYKNVEAQVPAGAKAELLVTKADGTEEKYPIHQFDSPGVIQGLHNTDKSIESFARSCFNFALDAKQDLWFATKDTISKKYDHRFKDIFQEIGEIPAGGH